MSRTEKTRNLGYALLLSAAYIVVCTAAPAVQYSVPAQSGLDSPVAIQRLALGQIFNVRSAEWKRTKRLDPSQNLAALPFRGQFVRADFPVSSMLPAVGRP